MTVQNTIKVLLAGETTTRIHTHFKGFASYETGYTSLDLDVFTKRFSGSNIEITFIPNHEISLRFPSSLEEMQAYDVIVISDAPADSFLLHPASLAGEIMPNRFKLIGDFVRAGGGFAMIGGWMSYGGFHGKAHYAYTPLADFLPVRIENGDDRMEVPEGCYPVAERPGHPILAGIAGPWPDFLGYNRVGSIGGETILSFPETGDPLLVVAPVEQGRVACFTSDLLPHWGSPRFQNWPDYERFWRQLFSWLASS